MALPDQTQTSSSSTRSSHLYPQALQLKLYQAFIFSIPILFSIILFLLFYLFYLKRRASSLQSSSPILIRRRIRSHTQASSTSQYVSSPCQMDTKGGLKEKLQVIPFDEELMKKDSQCCVCLGEFEMEEELMQVQSCKHVFHVECIHNWLHNNTTCPLCRCSVIPISISSKLDSTNRPLATVTDDASTEPPSQQHHHSIVVSSELQQQQQQRQGGSNVSVATNVITIGEESSSTAGSGGSVSGDCGRSSTRDGDLGNSVTINIQDN